MHTTPRSFRLKKQAIPPAGSSAIADTKAILDTSAKENRNLLIVFIAYLATAFILCLSISDLDLLIGTKNIQIPLLSIGLPIWAFYTFIPIILLLLHYDVLDNSVEHDKKLKAWLALKPKEPSAQLYPFIVDFARVSYGSVSKPTIAVVIRAAFVWLLYVGLPILLLTTYMVRFACLQENATLFHMVAIAADLYLLHRFKFRIRDQDCQSFLSAVRSKKLFFFVMGCWGLSVFLLWVLIQVVHISPKGPGYFSARVVYGRAVEWVFYAIRLERAINSKIGLRFVPRLTVLSARPYTVERDELYSSEIFLGDISRSGRGALFKPARNGFEWKSKNVLFANLTGSEFQLAEFIDVDGQWSTFYRANLEGAQFKGSDFTGADFFGGELSGAFIMDTKFDGSSFSTASLRGATLINARCNFCNFSGADLDSSQFRNSYLSGSSFANAFLGFSRVTNNDMRGCNFDGAELAGTVIEGFTGFQFIGSSWVGIRNSDMVEVKFRTQVPMALAASSNNFRFQVGWREISGGIGKREDDLYELKTGGSGILALIKEFDVRMRNSTGEILFFNDLLKTMSVPFYAQANVLQATQARACRDWWTTRGMLWNGQRDLRVYVRDEPRCDEYSDLLYGFKNLNDETKAFKPLEKNDTGTPGDFLPSPFSNPE
jgi:uncharacterized protein YjbI with pentapeptide repeats